MQTKGTMKSWAVLAFSSLASSFFEIKMTWKAASSSVRVRSWRPCE